MSTARPHTHHALPAPVVHAGFSVPQSKSHVLAGVQDAYWNDEEAVRCTLSHAAMALIKIRLAGGRRMPALPRRDGHFRSEF